MTCTCPTCGQDVAASADLRFDHLSGALFANGKAFQLTQRQADIFEVLLRVAPAPAHTERILRAVYGAGKHPESSNIIGVHVYAANRALRGSGIHIDGGTGRGYSIVFREAPEKGGAA